MKRLFFLLLVSTFLSTLLAQGSLKGKIVDAETGEPLIGVNILLDQDIPGTVTNSMGEFSFENLETGNLKIIASYVGYGRLVKSIYITGSERKITIKMFRAVIETDEIVVTASKSEQSIGEVAGRVELVTPREIIASSAQSADELFKFTSGVNVDRTMGVFDRPTIGIRGITGGEQGRVLALLDGVPINKSDGGTITWNRINQNDIERVEIFKGPGSSIYGNNAMGGVVNFITKRKKNKGFSGFAGFSYGDYNTHKEQAFISGKLDDSSGVFFNASFMNRQSDGYIDTREEWRDEYTVESFLEEIAVSGKLGYAFSDNSFFEAEYNYYDDKRGNGNKILASDGSYYTHKTDFIRTKLNTEFAGFKVDLNAYYQMEKYLRVSESMKKGVYQRFDVEADRTDLGAILNLNYKFGSHSITLGGEAKIGEIDGADVYQTSSDIVKNKGEINAVAGFIQDEWKLSENFIVTLGARFDQVVFTNGQFDLINPTGVTDFMEKYERDSVEYDWKSLTPKIAFKYIIDEHTSLYASFSQGFRAATLDDLTRSGFISGGFKVANSELDPENVDNIEFGMNIDFNKKLFILPSIYYMNGKDFHYYLETGDAIFGGSRKVIQKDNISKVRIVGADLDLKYFLSPRITLYGNYTYTNSEIVEYQDKPELEGNKLTYTPEHMANAGIIYLNDYVNFSMNMNFKDEQFLSDDNSETVFDKTTQSDYPNMIESYVTVDLKLWKKLFDHVNLSVSIQNVFDNKFVKHYDRISLGRFIVGEININL